MALLGKWFGFGRDEIYDQAIDAYDHGDWEGAIERFESCIEQPTDASMARLSRFYLAESYAQLGRAFMRCGGFIDAVRNLSVAIEISPNYPDLYVALARAYAQLGDRDRRRKSIDKALSINPRFVDAIVERGILVYEDGDYADGLGQLKSAVEADPALDGQPYSLGLAAHQAQDYKLAAASFAGMALEESQPAHIHVRLANNYHRERMVDEALREYGIALGLLPGYADLHCKYAQCLLDLGRTEEAIEQFREALRLNPRYVQAHAYLGVALHRSKLEDQARRELQKALDLDPYNAVALQEVQRLRTA